MDVKQFEVEFMIKYVDWKVEDDTDQGDMSTQQNYYGRMIAMDFVKDLMKKYLGYLSD